MHPEGKIKFNKANSGLCIETFSRNIAAHTIIKILDRGIGTPARVETNNGAPLAAVVREGCTRSDETSAGRAAKTNRGAPPPTSEK